MELDRPHFRNTSTNPSELLICFSTSRPSSSSSMKLTKSILSPGRAARDNGAGALSLSSSLSRRLRTNGSIKSGRGQASPFFSTSKKRGPGFENPEPSSPKVTCIGQVRVKTKKRVKQNRSLSRRRSGDMSFRKIEQNQIDGVHYQQRTHFSICEALSSCLFPCKSSCYERGKVDKSNENGCGAVFTRWLVSYNDEEGGKRREIELVVGGGDEDEDVEEEGEEDERRVSMRRSSRRHVFEDIVVRDDVIEVKGQGCDSEELAPPRMSLCIPPKNALLLMRCRSDPMKVAALANRFTFDPSIEKVEHVEDDNDCDDEIGKVEIFGGGIGAIDDSVNVVVECPDEVHEIVTEVEDEQIHGEKVAMDHEMVEEEEDHEKDEVESNMSSFEDLLEIQENTEQHYEDCPIENNEEQLPEGAICNLSPSSESEKDEIENPSEISSFPEDEAPPMENLEEENDEEDAVQRFPENPHQESVAEDVKEDPITIDGRSGTITRKSEPVLPDCLLLMMCEPKLSMEVSKETWVCSTDFVRWLPERPPAPAKQPKPDPEPPVKRRLSTDKPPRHSIDKKPAEPPLQPRRSSCSLPPAAASMASMIEQKFVNAVAYEPFVLTRCKSEPMRTAAAKLMPESFYWKNAIRKLEPHRRASVGVGAAGVGC